MSWLQSKEVVRGPLFEIGEAGYCGARVVRIIHNLRRFDVGTFAVEELITNCIVVHALLLGAGCNVAMFRTEARDSQFGVLGSASEETPAHRHTRLGLAPALHAPCSHIRRRGVP